MRNVRSLIVIVLVACVGCSAPVSVRGGERDSRTGGVAVMLSERDLRGKRFRRFELDPDGTLRVGGGKAARLGHTVWSGALTDEELQAVLDVLARADYFRATPNCQPRVVDGEETMFATLEIATAEAKWRHDLVGSCPALAPLRAAFDAAALKRFKPQLDALPEPGVQPALRR